MTQKESDRLTALLSSAAELGRLALAEMDSNAADTAKLRERAENLRGDIKTGDRIAANYDGPRYIGLAKVGALFGAAFNDPDTQEARDTAKAMADSFAASSTKASAKTQKTGGTNAGFTQVIRLGNKAETVRRTIQSRIDHWLNVADEAEGLKDAKEKASIIRNAKRFTVPCGDAPMENGDWPTNNAGERKRPKHNGRPVQTLDIGGITVNIKYGRGTSRSAQLAAYAELFGTYGDAALDSRVVDAFLDNGGEYADAPADSPEAFASQAVAALTALNLAGANTSADAAMISLALAVCERIAALGLANSRAAGDSRMAETRPGAGLVNDSAKDSDDSDTAKESAPEAPETPTDDEAPVPLGATPPGGSSRRRARRAA